MRQQEQGYTFEITMRLKLGSRPEAVSEHKLSPSAIECQDIPHGGFVDEENAWLVDYIKSFKFLASDIFLEKRETDKNYDASSDPLLPLFAENFLQAIMIINAIYLLQSGGTERKTEWYSIKVEKRRVVVDVQFHWDDDYAEKLEALLAERLRTRKSPSIHSEIPLSLSENIEMISSPLFHGLQSVYATGGFLTTKDNPWPVADLSNGEMKAYAELKPKEADAVAYYDDERVMQLQEQMSRQVADMDDETADILDAVSYVWLSNAKTPENFAKISSDDVLRMRGLKPKKNSCGYGNQYTSEQYIKTAKHLSTLGDTWITVQTMECTEKKDGKKGPYYKRTKWAGESRAIVIENRFGQQRLTGEVDIGKNVFWNYKIGSVFGQFLFGPGRQTALISCKALHYDPMRQQWEKRLTRYLAWQWRIRQSSGLYMEPYRIETLLDTIKEKIDPQHPLRTKNRFDGALDRLEKDGVIAGWQYDTGWNEEIVGQRGWWQNWLKTKVTIEPPLEITEHYKNISLPNKQAKALPAPQSAGNVDVAIERKRRSLTLMQASEQMDISTGMLSQAERGMKVGKKTLSKIEKWMREK